MAAIKSAMLVQGAYWDLMLRGDGILCKDPCVVDTLVRL